MSLIQKIETEIEACTAKHKKGFKGFFTSRKNKSAICTAQIRSKYSKQLAAQSAAQAKEQTEIKEQLFASASNTQSIVLIGAAVVAGIIMLLPNKK